MKSIHVLLLFAHKQLRPFIALCHHHRIVKKNINWPLQLYNPPKQPECPTSATADNSASMQVQKNTQSANFDLSITFTGYDGFPFWCNIAVYIIWEKKSFLPKSTYRWLSAATWLSGKFILLLLIVTYYLNGIFFTCTQLNCL